MNGQHNSDRSKIVMPAKAGIQEEKARIAGTGAGFLIPLTLALSHPGEGIE